MFVAPCMHNTLPSQESPAKDKATTIQEKAACMRSGEASQSQLTGSQPIHITSLPTRVVFNEIPFTSLHTPTFVRTWIRIQMVQFSYVNIMSCGVVHVYVRTYICACFC